MRRLQRQSVRATPGQLKALLAAAPAEAGSGDAVAYLCGDRVWAASDAAPPLIAWLAGRRRRLCLEERLEEILLPLLWEEEGRPRRCLPCLEQGTWLWQDVSPSPQASSAEAVEVGPERLAWFSPLPPQRSGISDYSAALISQLSHHFEIDVVADPATTPLPAGAHAMVSREAFERDPQSYSHLLFQLGNSTLHLEDLRQLRRQSGAVVLHDFFLSHGLCSHEADRQLGGDVMQRLYRSHGYQACQLHALDQQQGEERAIWRYPCNLDPLQWASGVIVHSREALRLAESCFGPGATQGWTVVPHLKRLAATTPSARRSARLALALPEQAFVVCSFGFLGVAKLTDRLLQGFLSSSLAADPQVVFVFAGSDAGNRSLRLQLELAVAEASRRGALRAEVRFTGWISAEVYQRYLVAADAAVQLRTSSRGETSGTVLDCMGAGVPLIVNAHGSMRELPEQAVLRLPDHCTSQDIARALQHLRQDPERRRRLSEASLAHVAEHHDPARCALRYAQAIRDATLQRARRRRWLTAAAHAVSEGVDPVRAANSLAVLRPPQPRQRQLFLDVSVVARHDLGSGVQRVVRAITEQLLLHPPQGFRVEPVRASEEGQGLVHARRFALQLLGLPDQDWPETPIHPHAGDVFVGLDLDQAGVVRRRGTFQLLRALGVAVHFVVHDLLPCRQPQYFPPGAGDWHRAWLEVVSECDGALCVSRSVAADLRQWLQEQGSPALAHGLAIGWFHHGSDFCPPTQDPSEAEAAQLSQIPEGTTLLMVGTVEPRKGYLDVIEAATQLWQKGGRFNLVIVGREGWTDLPQAKRRTIPATVARLRGHPLRDRHLFWFEDASDAQLQALYRRADGLIAASYGEGFGIPLIEAARAGLPLLLRDLPVFREVSAGRASFFPERADSAQLQLALSRFVQLLETGMAVRAAEALPCQTWRQSATQLIQALGLAWEATPMEAAPPPLEEQQAPFEPEPPSALELPLSAMVPALLSHGRRHVRRVKGRLQSLRQRVRRLRQRARQLRRRWRGRSPSPVSAAAQPLPDTHPAVLLDTARPWLDDLNSEVQLQHSPAVAEEQGR